jgi:hypothetical protein
MQTLCETNHIKFHIMGLYNILFLSYFCYIRSIVPSSKRYIAHMTKNGIKFSDIRFQTVRCPKRCVITNTFLIKQEYS